MKLSSLFEGAPDLEIRSFMTDSRVPSKDALFFCIKGMSTDGHHYIRQAKRNGAVAVVYSDEPASLDADLVYIRVQDVMAALNQLAPRFYGDPSEKMKILGVTGTNGKSTISWIERYLIERYEPCGYIGTIAVIYGDTVEPEHLTTPDVVELNEILCRMEKAGMKAVTMECSSQGIDLHRVDSVHFAGLTFTNLTEDHFDYHNNFENYYAAKAKLFTMASPDTPSIINIDDNYGMRLTKEAAGRVVTLSCDHKADYQAVNIQLHPDGTDFDLLHEGEAVHVHTKLVALYNVYNLAASLATVHEAMGYPLAEMAKDCGDIPQVPGRLERIDEGQPFSVIVDYAHTPDGLEKFLSFCRQVTKPESKVIAVFGSAGNRDSAKRPAMGETADKYCDRIILTSEDPRTEDPEAIARQIQSGIHSAASMIILDRYEAIRQGIDLASPGDTVVILGKGDETYMSVQGVSQPWIGDPEAAREAIRAYYGEQEEQSNGTE